MTKALADVMSSVYTESIQLNEHMYQIYQINVNTVHLLKEIKKTMQRKS